MTERPGQMDLIELSTGAKRMPVARRQELKCRQWSCFCCCCCCLTPGKLPTVRATQKSCGESCEDQTMREQREPIALWGTANASNWLACVCAWACVGVYVPPYVRMLLSFLLWLPACLLLPCGFSQCIAQILGVYQFQFIAVCHSGVDFDI